MPRIILVGLDGSESSWRAFDEALTQAKATSSEVRALSVHEELPVSPNALEIINADEAANEATAKIIDHAEGVMKGSGVEVKFLTRYGDSARTLLETAKEIQAELIVIGKKGRSSVWSALVGTSVDKIVRDAHCSVLVVK